MDKDIKLIKIKSKLKLGKRLLLLLKKQDNIKLNKLNENILYYDGQLKKYCLIYIQRFGFEEYIKKCKNYDIKQLVLKSDCENNKNEVFQNLNNSDRINRFFKFEINDNEEFNDLIKVLNIIIESRLEYVEKYNGLVKEIRNTYPSLILYNNKNGIIEKNWKGVNLVNVKGIYKNYIKENNKLKLLIDRKMIYYEYGEEVYNDNITYYDYFDIDKIIHEEDILDFQNNKEWIGKWVDRWEDWLEFLNDNNDEYK